MATATLVRRPPDRFRQLLNLALAVAQPVTTVLCFALGTSFEEATRSGVGEPPIVPAGYTFTIWTLIYAGSIVYAAYQASAARREDSLLRRIGFLTASAFLGTSTWLVMARFNLVWLTVACIVGMMASLAGVLRAFIQEGAPRTAAERWCVVWPLSVFAGYVTVATFANTAAALKVSGWPPAGSPETGWTIALLLAAGSVGAWIVVVSGGNAGYALAVVWALVGIVVANAVERAENVPVAVVAGAMAAVVALALAWTRLPSGLPPA